MANKNIGPNPKSRFIELLDEYVGLLFDASSKDESFSVGSDKPDYESFYLSKPSEHLASLNSIHIVREYGGRTKIVSSRTNWDEHTELVSGHIIDITERNGAIDEVMNMRPDRPIAEHQQSLEPGQAEAIGSHLDALILNARQTRGLMVPTFSEFVYSNSKQLGQES